MTIYEILAITISIVAIIIPFIQLFIKHIILKIKLSFYPNGKIKLFFNISGSYFRFDGAFEAKNKSISIKQIKAKIRKVQSGNELNYCWSTFISPITQSLWGNYSQVLETAHPFKIEAGNICCAFIEFADEYNSAGKAISNAISSLYNNIDLNHFQSYDEALEAIISNPNYQKTIACIEKQFFWDLGKYEINIIVNYANTTKVFSYCFTINQNDIEVLQKNIREIIINPLKQRFNQQLDFHTVDIEIGSFNA